MEYTVSVVGSRGVGKTSLIVRFATGKYYPIKEDPLCYPVKLETNCGTIILNLWDCILPCPHAYIGVAEKDNQKSIDYIENFNTNNIPYITCINKCTEPSPLHISSKYNYNLDELMLIVCQSITGNSQLKFL